MIRKLVRQMLTAQVFSALTVSLCLLIDNVMIGRFLGEEAIAAYGFANPVLLAIGALGSLLSAGIQVACGKSLGKGSQEETNCGYSSAVAVAGVVSVLFAAAVLIFSPLLAHALGGGTRGKLFEMTRDYLRGFSVGAPASMGALVLVPFLQMAGKNRLLITAVLCMTVSDVALDLVSIACDGGMLGMGLASAGSYYIAVGVSLVYFLSKKCVFRFSFGRVTLRKIIELFRSGIPAGFTMGSAMILVFLLNRILRFADGGGSNAVAAYAVISTIGNAAYCISTGIGGTSLTLGGILYHEEDRSGLRELVRLMCRYSVLLGLVMGVLLLIFAPPLIRLFIPNAGATQKMATLGLRIFAAGLIPCCVNNALKNIYQATGRVALTEILSLLEGAALPALAAFAVSRFLGADGVWFYSVAGELLTLLGIGLYIRLRTSRLPWQEGACLMLKPDFGAAPDDLLELQITKMQDVADAAQRAETFCLEHGQSTRLASHIALCVEEMAGNTIQYGFVKDGKQHHLAVRILYKAGQWVLRFRDDCGAFDPIHYVPGSEQDHVGIRLAMALSEEATYTYSRSLNNLMLKLRAE